MAEREPGAAGTLNSDNTVNVNPFKKMGFNSGDFMARGAKVKWSAGLGRNSLTLITDDYKDKRTVTTHQGDPLYNAMVALDPYLATYPEYEARALYPVWRICLDHAQHVTSFEAMPMNREEKIAAESRAIFDALHAVGREVGIGWGTVSSIARDCQREYTDDWHVTAERLIREYSATEKSNRLLGLIMFRKNEWDYWWREDANAYPRDMRDVEGNLMSTLDEVFPRTADGKPADEAIPHFSQAPAYHVEERNRKAKYKVCAMLPAAEWDTWIHKIFDVKSRKEITLSESETLKIIEDEVDLKYGPKKEKPVTDLPAEAISKEQWTEFEKTWTARGFKRADILSALNRDSAANDGDSVTRYSEWAFSLNEATTVMEAADTKRFEDAIKKPASAPVEPAKTNEPIVPKIVPVATAKPDTDGVIEAEVIPEQPKALATVPSTFDSARALMMIRGKMDLLQAVYHELLQKEVDYGTVPGTDKPTLLKPGAEKLLTAFDFYPMFKPTQQSASDWKNGIFFYEYECVIYNRASGRIEGSGIGNCSSMESKYRWRKAERVCPQCGKPAIIKGKEEYGGGYICFGKKGGCGSKFKDDDKSIIDQVVGRIENPDIFDQVNTISKMAQKRALVAATLNATGASWRFTQDVEDLPDFGTMAA